MDCNCYSPSSGGFFIQILKESNFKTMWKTNTYGQPSCQAPSPPGRLTGHSSKAAPSLNLGKDLGKLGHPTQSEIFHLVSLPSPMLDF